MEHLGLLTKSVSELAIEVGQFIREEAQNFDTDKVELKGKSDLVSYVDKQAEKKIVKRLQELLPGCGFLTEENTIAQNEAEYRWIIDPLDGTTNFVHGMPSYAVSIGLENDGAIILGVIYEITHDELFSAYKGGGAFLNGKPIEVSKAETIEESLFATGFPIHNFSNLNEYLAILNELMKNSHGLRRLGSAATDMAYVACGRCEGFFEYNLNPWDVAAGVIIVQEAGGTVTDFSGGNNFLGGREMVAAGAVYHHLLTIIKKFWTPV